MNQKQPMVLNTKLLAIIIAALLAVGVALTIYMGQSSNSSEASPQTDHSIIGKIVCLPHKNPSEPHTLECATGLKAENGKHYALKNMSEKDSAKAMESFEKRVEVDGELTPPAQNEKYDIVGNIEVKQLMILKD